MLYWERIDDNTNGYYKSLINASEKVGFNINEEKLEYMMISWKNEKQVQNESLKWKSTGLKGVDKFKYIKLIG